MSPMRIIILVVAAVAAVLAALLVRSATSDSGPAERSEPVERIVEVQVSEQKVLVARTDLRVGTLMTPDDFKWADWPDRTISPNFFTEENAPEAMEELTGSVVRSALFEDEPIMPQKIVQKGETGFMAALLRPGWRAISVEISPESASAGFILPDDRVDVILTQIVEVDTGAGKDEYTYTETILQNVRILAIDQAFTTIDGTPTMAGSTATMELTPDQAERIATASRSGALSLTLRSVADADFNNGDTVAEGEIFGTLNGGTSSVTVYRRGNATAEGS
ncbi:MAG: Flp pilus assembly protein CpaB [Pseudomonadota bacterium]